MNTMGSKRGERRSLHLCNTPSPTTLITFLDLATSLELLDSGVRLLAA
jgi:hypothetical protein